MVSDGIRCPCDCASRIRRESTCTPARHPCPGGQHDRAGAEAHQTSPDRGVNDGYGCSDLFQCVATLASHDLDFLCCRCNAAADNMGSVVNFREGFVTAVGDLAKALADAVSELTKEAHVCCFIIDERSSPVFVFEFGVKIYKELERRGMIQ
jgi:hypothetical protein